MTGISNPISALIIYSYLPMSNKMNAPEIPGKIMAQMASAPQKKIKKRLVGVSVGERIVMK